MTELFDNTSTVFRAIGVSALRPHGRSVRIPDGTVALAAPKKGTGAPSLLRGGSDVRTDRALQVFAAGAIEIDVPVFDVPSQDGFACRVQARLAVSLDVDEVEALQDFVRAIAGNRESVTRAELGRALAEDVRMGAKKLLADRAVDALHERDLATEAERPLASALRKTLLAGGLAFHGVSRLMVDCPELEKLRRQSAEAKKQEVISRQRQRMRELWEKDRRRELLSRHELDEFIKALEHDGMLKDLERKQEALDAQETADKAWLEYQRQQHDLQKTLDSLEVSRQLAIDRMKFEERLAQARRAHDTLKGATLEFFISTLEDEQEKARLYRQLMARDMTPEQIEKLGATDRDIEVIVEKVLGRIETLLSRGADSGMFRSFGHRQPVQSTHRVLIAVGKRILAFDPSDSRGSDRPSEVIDVSRHPLGSLRSVRVDRHEGETIVLAGARQGVYAIPAASPHRVQEHAFFTESVHKGGTNSAVIAGNRIYAAHSEQGLSWWPIDDPTHLSVPVFTEMTGNHETTRGLLREPATGMLWFTTGGLVCAFDPAAPGQAPDQVWRGGGREVTGLVPLGNAIYGGNRDGQLLRWSGDDEDQSPAILRQEQHAIYMMKLVQMRGLPHLVFGSKAYGATARSLNETGLCTRFNADVPIRWVDAASDYVFGVSADQTQLFVWSTADPHTPVRCITPGDKIQDLAIWHR